MSPTSPVGDWRHRGRDFVLANLVEVAVAETATVFAGAPATHSPGGRGRVVTGRG